MQKKEFEEKQSKKNQDFLKILLRKVLVYTVSVVLVCGLVLGILAIRNHQQQEEAQSLVALEEASKETAKAALTEDEIEAFFKDHKKETEIEETQEAETQEPETEENATQEAEDISQMVDWEGLWEVNPDVYAWITIPGTNIDYPVLQHATDNSYYLNYNIDGSYGFPGCIYTENLNSKDFTDNNTVIYGHDLKAGTMFTQLHNFREKEFFDEYDRVYIYTPDRTYEYLIFATYVYDDRHLMYSFDFANEDVYAAYLESVLTRRDLTSNIREGVEVTKEDKIITLETCMKREPDKRLIVQAVLQ